MRREGSRGKGKGHVHTFPGPSLSVHLSSPEPPVPITEVSSLWIQPSSPPSAIESPMKASSPHAHLSHSPASPCRPQHQSLLQTHQVTAEEPDNGDPAVLTPACTEHPLDRMKEP